MYVGTWYKDHIVSIMCVLGIYRLLSGFPVAQGVLSVCRLLSAFPGAGGVFSVCRLLSSFPGAPRCP